MLAVYAAGYVITEPEAAQAAAMPPAAPTLPPGTYRDGIYLGEGTGPFGSVFVTVAIHGGRIASVWINQTTTTFPSQVIAGLPDQAVRTQARTIDAASGATASSAAFVAAIRSAIAQARS